MREIKFRVWDKKTKKMRQLVHMVFNTGFGIEPNDNTIKLIWVKGKDIIEDKDIQIQRENNFELMQYTGLKDKNGKEIYEGDIVNIVLEENINIVEKAVIKYQGASFYGKTNTDLWDLDSYQYIEILGNIYDNPELLKEEHK